MTRSSNPRRVPIKCYCRLLVHNRSSQFNCHQCCSIATCDRIIPAVVIGELLTVAHMFGTAPSSSWTLILDSFVSWYFNLSSTFGFLELARTSSHRRCGWSVDQPFWHPSLTRFGVTCFCRASFSLCFNFLCCWFFVGWADSGNLVFAAIYFYCPRSRNTSSILASTASNLWAFSISIQ